MNKENEQNEVGISLGKHWNANETDRSGISKKMYSFCERKKNWMTKSMYINGNVKIMFS